MFTRIVVGLDGSRPADAAAEAALNLSGAFGSEVIFASVIEEQPHYVSTSEEASSEDASAKAYYGALHDRWMEQAARLGVPARSALLEGHEARQLLQFVADSQADLLMIGHAGHSAPWEDEIGGTASQLLLRSPRSVLMIRAREGWNGRFGALMVGLDGSPVGWEAFDTALALAARTHASLIIISVVEQSGAATRAMEAGASGVMVKPEMGTAAQATQPRSPSLLTQVQARAVARAASAGVSLELVTVDGPVSDALTHMAQERDVDLLILGATGHERPWSPTAGGTARKVMEEARCAVMLVRSAGSDLKVSDVMRPASAIVQPDTPLTDALALLLDGEARLVSVTDERGALIGLLTLTTLVHRLRPALSERREPTRSPEEARRAMERLLEGRAVREAMITRMRTIQPETPLHLAARFLISNRLTRAPVVDANRRLLGIISERDIVRTLAPRGASSSAESAPTAAFPAEMDGQAAAGSVSALLDRSIPLIEWSAHVDEALAAVARAANGLVLVVDDEGRYDGIIDERSVLTRALPSEDRSTPWRMGLTRLLTRSHMGALAGESERVVEPITTASLVNRSAQTFTLDTPVADALARMIAADESDVGVALTTDGRPIGTLWRGTALRALIRG